MAIESLISLISRLSSSQVPRRARRQLSYFRAESADKLRGNEVRLDGSVGRPNEAYGGLKLANEVVNSKNLYDQQPYRNRHGQEHLVSDTHS